MASSKVILTKMKNLKKFALPLQILGMFFLCALFGEHLSIEVKSFFYAISKTIRVVLNLTMPVIIFACLFNSILDLREKALGFVLLIFLLVSLSNFIATMVGYTVGSWGIEHVFGDLANLSAAASEPLHPLWDLEKIKIGSRSLLKYFPIQNVHGMLMALLLGTLACAYPKPIFQKIATHGNHFVNWFLRKIFIKTLPLFALGFILNMEHDGVLSKVLENYLPLFLLVIGTELAYGLTFILFAANFDVKQAWHYFRSISPAALIGFSTMSSLAALPTTSNALKRHTEREASIDLILPATVNIHMIGSSIVIPFLTLYVLSAFGMPSLGIKEYAEFALWFVVYKFTVAAVPGGSVYAMLPILKSVLGFSDEMGSMVVSLYLLFNPFIAAFNVFTNSALALILSRIFQRWFAKPALSESATLVP